MWKEIWKKKKKKEEEEEERTRNVKTKRVETTSSFERENPFGSVVLSREDFNFFVRNTPLQF